jgi:hypothetical protein
VPCAAGPRRVRRRRDGGQHESVALVYGRQVALQDCPLAAAVCHQQESHDGLGRQVRSTDAAWFAVGVIDLDRADQLRVVMTGAGVPTVRLEGEQPRQPVHSNVDAVSEDGQLLLFVSGGVELGKELLYYRNRSSLVILLHEPNHRKRVDPLSALHSPPLCHSASLPLCRPISLLPT